MTTSCRLESSATASGPHARPQWSSWLALVAILAGCTGTLEENDGVEAAADAAVPAPPDGAPSSDAATVDDWGSEPTTDADIDRLGIAELSHDQVIFDGGTHRGLGYAEIVFPLSTEDDSLEGETIQMRVADGDGATWVDIGVIEDRSLRAVVRHPRHPAWQTPTFRIRGGDGRTKVAENRFAVGSVIGLWGQSDLFHVYYLGSSSVRGPEVKGEECLEVAMIRQRGEEPQPADAGIRRFVTGDWPAAVLSRSRTMPAGLAEAANAVHDAGCYPTLLLLHLQGGMGIDDQALETSFNDTAPPRWGDDERLIHATGITDADRGQRVGHVHYFFSSGSEGPYASEEFLAAAVFGADATGSPLSIPAEGIRLRNTSATRTVLFSMGEPYDWSYARLSYIAPYGRQSAYLTTLAAMAEGAFVDAFVDEPIGAPAFGFVKGERDGERDRAHPALDTPYGAQRASQIYARDLMRRSGASPGVRAIALDTVELHPGGDDRMVAVGWSGGAVTTPHLADGRPRLRGRPDVRRFALGGTPLSDVLIRDDEGELARRGRIWLRKNDGSPWTAADLRRLTFGESNQSSSSSGEDVASGWHAGHYAALDIDGGYTMAQRSVRYADLFSAFEAYAP